MEIQEMIDRSPITICNIELVDRIEELKRAGFIFNGETENKGLAYKRGNERIVFIVVEI